MLSRAAESLYWTARYVERAENLARLLDVDYHALLDRQVADRGEVWRRIILLLGEDSVYREHFDEYTAASVGEWLLWHPGNPNAVVSCVTEARENARSVREQISTEMWEALNKLFLLVRGASRASRPLGPHALFEQLRNGAHLFQGAADATTVHGETYEFIRLGLHLERAATTVRVVAGRYPVAVALAEDDSTRAQEIIALLRSCSAFEAYVKRHGLLFDPWTAADYLVRSEEFPRSARYCLSTCLASVSRISGPAGRPHRVLGRLCAELEFEEVQDVSGPAVRASLGELLGGIHLVGEELTSAYFSSRALPEGAALGRESQQQQQQQQQQGGPRRCG